MKGIQYHMKPRYNGLTSLVSLDTSKMTVALSKEDNSLIKVYYNKCKLYLRTGNWKCPTGASDDGVLYAEITDDEFFSLEKLDKIGSKICHRFNGTIMKTQEDGAENRTAGDGDEDDPGGPSLSYKSLLQLRQGIGGAEADPIDVFKISGLVSKYNKTYVFNDNNEMIYNPKTAGEGGLPAALPSDFSARFLLEIDGIRYYGGTYFWSIKAAQVKITDMAELPVGCQIFESEDDLQAYFAAVDAEPAPVLDDDEIDCVIDCDPDINELL